MTAISVELEPALESWKRHANIGGPASRTQRMRISSTLLGRTSGPIRCPPMLRLGLDFPSGVDPVIYATSLLHRQGFRDSEELRRRFGTPTTPCLCRALWPGAPRLEVAGADPDEVLRQALLLGLCTARRFDPLRPVIWTQASLTRALELFDTEEFYAS